MAVPDPSAVPAVAPAADRARGLPWSSLATLLFLPDSSRLLLVAVAWHLARHLAHGGRLADVAFPDLNVIVLILIDRWSRLSAPGSASRRWARFATWVATSSFTLGMAWGLAGPPAPNLEAVVWVTAVFSVFSTLYMLIFF